MAEIKSYENFPQWIPLIAILVSIFSYIIGAFILIGFGIIIVILYIAYCFSIELLVVFRSCKDCYYYGKICGLGKGKIAPFFVKKGDFNKFAKKKISWYDLIPDFLVGILPITGGIILSVLDLSLIRIGMIAVLGLLSFGGPAVIRGSFACKYCKQRKIGCPAEQLFNKKQSG